MPKQITTTANLFTDFSINPQNVTNTELLKHKTTLLIIVLYTEDSQTSN